ncbi:MAG: winged helix-turn-helix transcriptional regulator [Deltaproteobacteria bacterium]|jgi:DNA-binding Lrp family transcriptional regulator|nr:winged helix-turn-helix transcriptional regulator [Deltaproteobacteria bacterium]
MPEFTETEKNILRLVQGDLPDSKTPYAAIAQAAGTDEGAVLKLLRRLKREGAIRRFGATIRHQLAGFDHNVMLAWVADRKTADAAGPVAAAHPLVSHCYYRPTQTPDWPYSMFTMVHGRDKNECREVIDYILANTALREYAALTSLKELKKNSMTYF